MSTAPIIELVGAGKSYRSYSSFWWRLKGWITEVPSHFTDKWVLRNISFAVRPGESVGILGCNGAGKSTLLKLIAGTLPPTEGTVTTRGRVNALLELGMGFNPEFTAQQNVVHSCGLLGYKPAEIAEVLPAIRQFADIGDYFDQPMRTYSSGMHVRVSFAAATAFRPDLLIVDEALSVGDAFFQVKSFARIKEFKQLGTTILFVSHDTASIKSLCDRAILLDGGRIGRDGNAVAVADYYSALTTNRLVAEHVVQDEASELPVTRSGRREVEVVSVRTLDGDNDPKSVFFCGELARLEVCVEIRQRVAKLVQGFLLRNRLGHDVYGTNTFHLDQVVVDPVLGARYRFAFEFPVDLAEGVYSVSVASVDSDTVLWQNFDWIENVAMFRVIRAAQPFFIGVASLGASCSIKVETTVADHDARALP